MGVGNFVGEAWRASKSFVIGLNITFSEMVFRPPITVFYPNEKDTVPGWFRGIPVQKTNLYTGEYQCTSCAQCEIACPVGVITLKWHQDPDTKKKVVDRYAIDMSRCMLCNLCVEACLFDSLVMGNEYELGKTNPENLVYEFPDLLKLGLKYSSPVLPGVKTKRTLPHWVFADITDATEADIQDENGFLGRAPLGRGYEAKLKPQFQTKEEPAAEAKPEPAKPAEPAAKPVEPAAAPAEAVAKPAEPVAKPVEPAVAPAEPVAKPAEPAAKDGEEAK